MTESRREFLKKSGGCALGMVTLATQMQHLGLMSALAQKVQDEQASPEGGANYKALVMVFFSGGNDANNMVIPNHADATISNYSTYATLRGVDLAIPQASLLPISVPRMGGLTYGLHPSFGTGATNAGIHPLWAAGKMAIVTNCGTLVRPTTKAQMSQSTHPKPYQLYSHSDQTAQYQTGISNTQAFTGWGGRVSDKLTAGSNPTALIPMVTSIAGAQLFTSGQTTLPMAINDSNTSLANVLNPVGFTANGGPARLTAFNALRGIDLESNFVSAASHVTDLAMQANTALQAPGDTTVTFPNTSIGRQLRQVARLIKKRSELNVNRQIFYVQIGGFDTHTGEPAQHVNLYGQFSQAARAFYDELGTATQNAQNDVTLCTLSDFGRTMQPSGSGTGVGTDHAWGNHMIVMGGSVLGGNFYGMNTATNGTPFPHLQMGGLDDTDSGTNPRGRWIPTTSVDQYAATMARWFGLAEADMASVFPNIGNFATSNLGFMP